MFKYRQHEMVNFSEKGLRPLNLETKRDKIFKI